MKLALGLDLYRNAQVEVPVVQWCGVTSPPNWQHHMPLLGVRRDLAQINEHTGYRQVEVHTRHRLTR